MSTEIQQELDYIKSDEFRLGEYIYLGIRLKS